MHSFSDHNNLVPFHFYCKEIMLKSKKVSKDFVTISSLLR